MIMNIVVRFPEGQSETNVMERLREIVEKRSLEEVDVRMEGCLHVVRFKPPQFRFDNKLGTTSTEEAVVDCTFDGRLLEIVHEEKKI